MQDATYSKFSSWPAKGTLNVTIVGAGNLAHVLGGMLGARVSEFNIMILSRKAKQIEEHATKQGITVRLQAKSADQKDEFVTGRVSRVSSNPADVIPQADFIVMTTPSHARATMCKLIVPHIDRKRPVFFGVMPGMGGFDWICRQVCKAHNINNVIIWAIKDVPYMSAFTVPGKSVTNLGPKKGLYFFFANYYKAVLLAQHVLQHMTKIPVHILPNFMVITLTPGNPIMHPSIMYGMYGPYSQWDGKPQAERPLFYEQVNEMSSYFLTKCDEEVQSIKKAITKLTGADLTVVWPLRENLKHVYGDIVGDNRTLMLAMRTNRAYATIRTPLKQVENGFLPDVEHRFFQEDVPFGLVILRDIADLVGVKTPFIDEILLWCQGLMGKQYLTPEGKLKGKDMKETGAPSVWGVKGVQELLPPPNAMGSAPAKQDKKSGDKPRSKL